MGRQSSGSRKVVIRLEHSPQRVIPVPARFSDLPRKGEEERRDGEAIALHKTHIWANSLKPVCFLCFLLFWCPFATFH